MALLHADHRMVPLKYYLLYHCASQDHFITLHGVPNVKFLNLVAVRPIWQGYYSAGITACYFLGACIQVNADLRILTSMILRQPRRSNRCEINLLPSLAPPSTIWLPIFHKGRHCGHSAQDRGRAAEFATPCDVAWWQVFPIALEATIVRLIMMELWS